MRFSFVSRKLEKAIEYLVDRHGPIDGRTRLLKLVYLADQRWQKRHGQTYTGARYYRWNHGPFAQEVLRALEWLDGVEITAEKISTANGVFYRYLSGDATRLRNVPLDPEFRKDLDDVASKWCDVPLQALLDSVYRDPDFKAAQFGDRLLS
jgi:hypothetical protein